jgi:hypothetical protein
MKQARAVVLSLSVVVLCGLFSAAQQSATTAANATAATVDSVLQRCHR